MSMNYHDFVIEITQNAGKILMSRADDAFAVTIKNNDPRDIVTAVDLEVNAFIVSAIKEKFPNHAIYSEEGNGKDVQSEYLWVIDPIDGTSNFSRHIPHFAICVGLLHNMIPIAGAVFNPVTRELFSFKKGGGAFLNGAPISVSKETELKNSSVLFHAGRKPELWQWGGEGYAKLLEHAKKTTNLGGSALDACFVAAGRVEANIYGRLSTFDIASALGILFEAGGIAVDEHGNQVVFSKEPQKIFMFNNENIKKAVLSIF